jgi:hypothetical protein
LTVNKSLVMLIYIVHVFPYRIIIDTLRYVLILYFVNSYMSCLWYYYYIYTL